MTHQVQVNPTQRNTPNLEQTLRPHADVFETESALELRLDMPGANPDSIEVSLEKGLLSVRARATGDVPEGYEVLSQPFGGGLYERDFRLRTEVLEDEITARFAHGVLTLGLPKRPRREVKIDVQTN